MAPTAPSSSSAPSKRTKPPRRLTVEKKAAIIKQVQSGRSQTEVGREFGISKQTVSDFIKNNVKILEVAAKSTGAGKKNASHSVYPQLEEALLVWLSAMIAKKIPVSGDILKQKAEAQCSPGLLDKRGVLPGGTWCVTRYAGPQIRARSRVAEVLRSQVPVFGPLAGSRATERCRAVPGGVLGSNTGRRFLITAPKLCLVVSRVRRGMPIAELQHRSCVEQHFGTEQTVLRPRQKSSPRWSRHLLDAATAAEEQ
ncbi:hypothetical protein HPB50_005765 [Hyalomma asiaticum]|uniref:Uncharacterized protein n=1 Tax=Hyalomma asiaticum TaxID=266040 RepID=A0ACB7SEE4_HYAAI|nr:hypothetical protein HPB50_005765 [Hyalomma asiaticum]